ncbi:MAG: S-layer family protein, partial [Cyanobacteria bacterium P01_F01_bin.143]
SVSLNEDSSISSAGDANINSESISLNDNSGIYSFRNSFSLGGDINITSKYINIANQSDILTQTNRSLNAPNIQIEATESIEISNLDSSISSETGSSGSSGNITINTPELRILDGAQISANNFITESFEIVNNRLIRRILPRQLDGSGSAGTIEITANNTTLEDQGGITTISSAGEGGNIQLTVGNLLSLNNNSEISATAGVADTPGNGGNITIDAKFVIAVPNQNSDITANAFNGDGGNINIITEGLFGIEARSSDSNTETNDISASSQLGLSGTIAINNPNVDPTSGLVELPAQTTDPSDKVIAGCAAVEGNSFTITGKGGLPEDPTTTIRGKAILSDLRDFTESDSTEDLAPVTKRSRQQTPRSIVQVKGWLINQDGEVELVAELPQEASFLKPHNCQDLAKQ